MKEIVIIGAGDLGKEVVWLIEDINKQSPTYLILGFLDDDESKTGKEFYGYKVLGKIDILNGLESKHQIKAVIAIQYGDIRKRIAETYKNFTQWETIIHPSAVIASSAWIEKGCIIFPHVTISVDSRLGKFGLFYIHSTICNDCRIGEYVSVMSDVSVSEHALIGDKTYLSAGCTVYPHITVGKDVKAAVGSTIVKNCDDGLKIGERNNGFFLFK
jgi:UDP-3-O-[3-hydroxymyristoyl] glucosamine N-acyltransferase